MPKQILIFISLLFCVEIRFAEGSLTPSDFPGYCPTSYTKIAPTDFHTHQQLNFRSSESRVELHGLQCEKIDFVSRKVLATWHLYFCEDLNPTSYVESGFYLPLKSWFEFHPNFKKAEFMLFPKYTKFWRQKVIRAEKEYEWIGFNFMRNHTSQMQIEFLSPWVDGSSGFQKGTVSKAAVVFDLMKMAPLEDYYECRLY